jgi:hypothetical protein
MFAKIAAFEFRYQLRQPAFWVIAILFGLIAFGAVASENVSLGSGGNVLKNAPVAIAQLHIITGIFFMLATTAVVANVVVRDVQTGFGPMIQATRVSKFDDLYGRFAGAFAAVALCFLSIDLGVLLGTVMPWVDPETIGPFRPIDFLWSYFVLGLPAIFLTSALFFALATVTRSMMATYVGVVGVFILYLTVTSVFGDKPEYEQVMAWFDPFGGGAYGLVTKYWTAAERNTLNPAIDGVLGGNRLVWLAVALGALIAAYALFQPSTRGAKVKKVARLQAQAEAQVESHA